MNTSAKAKSWRAKQLKIIIVKNAKLKNWDTVIENAARELDLGVRGIIGISILIGRRRA